MPDAKSYPYATHLNVLYPPLAVVDVDSRLTTLKRHVSLPCVTAEAIGRCARCLRRQRSGA